jgi:YegS/Rv2252/BmrU family lipid kinase
MIRFFCLGMTPETLLSSAQPAPTPPSGAPGFKRRIRFIINPVAGTRKKHNIPDRIRKHLDHRRYDYDIIYTQGRGHATELAAQAAAEGIEVVAIAGGDGSVNETATGLLDTQTALAILPLGSGNGLARHLGYSPWVTSTLHVINACHIIDMDVGRVNDKYFFSLIGIGFDAFVAKIFDREKTRGLATYALASTMGLMRFKPFDFALESPAKKLEGRAFMLNVCNANQYGYNFRIAPKASVNDGQFDVVLTRAFPRYKAPRLIYDLSVENHLSSVYVQSFQASTLRIFTQDRVYLQIDGETQPKAREFNIQLEAGRLKMLVNPATHI